MPHQRGDAVVNDMSRDAVAHLVSETVRETLLQMGIDTSDPMAMQRDFQHLRQWREAGEAVKRHGILAIIGIFLSGAIALLIVGIKTWLK